MQYKLLFFIALLFLFILYNVRGFSNSNSRCSIEPFSIGVDDGDDGDDGDGGDGDTHAIPNPAIDGGDSPAIPNPAIADCNITLNKDDCDLSSECKWNNTDNICFHNSQCRYNDNDKDNCNINSNCVYLSDICGKIHDSTQCNYSANCEYNNNSELCIASEYNNKCEPKCSETETDTDSNCCINTSINEVISGNLIFNSLWTDTYNPNIIYKNVTECSDEISKINGSTTFNSEELRSNMLDDAEDSISSNFDLINSIHTSHDVILNNYNSQDEEQSNNELSYNDTFLHKTQQELINAVNTQEDKIIGSPNHMKGPDSKENIILGFMYPNININSGTCTVTDSKHAIFTEAAWKSFNSKNKDDIDIIHKYNNSNPDNPIYTSFINDTNDETNDKYLISNIIKDNYDNGNTNFLTNNPGYNYVSKQKWNDGKIINHLRTKANQHDTSDGSYNKISMTARAGGDSIPKKYDYNLNNDEENRQWNLVFADETTGHYDPATNMADCRAVNGIWQSTILDSLDTIYNRPKYHDSGIWSKPILKKLIGDNTDEQKNASYNYNYSPEQLVQSDNCDKNSYYCVDDASKTYLIDNLDIRTNINNAIHQMQSIQSDSPDLTPDINEPSVYDEYIYTYTNSSTKDNLKTNLDTLFNKYDKMNINNICNNENYYPICADNASDCKVHITSHIPGSFKPGEDPIPEPKFTSITDCWPNKIMMTHIDENTNNAMNDDNNLNPGPNDMFGDSSYTYDEFGGKLIINKCSDLAYESTTLLNDPKYAEHAANLHWIKETCNNSADNQLKLCNWKNDKCISDIDSKDKLVRNLVRNDPGNLYPQHTFTFENNKMTRHEPAIYPYIDRSYKGQVSDHKRKLIHKGLANASNTIIPFCSTNGNKQTIAPEGDCVNVPPKNCEKYMMPVYMNRAQQTSSGVEASFNKCVSSNNMCSMGQSCLNTDELFNIKTPKPSATPTTIAAAIATATDVAKGKPKVFKKYIDGDFNNPKLHKFFNLDPYGHYNKAPLTIPTVIPKAAIHTLDGDNDGKVDPEDISDDGIRYLNKESNNLTNVFSYIGSSSCKDHADCNGPEFCNNANKCQSCVDAIDYRDFTRDTIGYNQFDQEYMQCSDPGCDKTAPLWDGELSDIKPPLCKKTNDRSIDCIGTIASTSPENSGKIINQIGDTNSLGTSISFSRDQCEGNQTIGDPIIDNTTQLEAGRCPVMAKSNVGQAAYLCNQSSEPIPSKQGHRKMCKYNTIKHFYGDDHTCTATGAEFNTVNKLPLNNCKYTPPHNPPENAYNIVKSVFSRHGLKEGITRCNIPLKTHYANLATDLNKVAPHSSYVGKIHTQIIQDANADGNLLPSWYNGYTKDNKCINTESDYSNTKRCSTGDIDDMNFHPYDVITTKLVSEPDSYKNINLLELSNDYMGNIASNTGSNEFCEPCIGSPFIPSGISPNISSTDTKFSGDYIKEYLCENGHTNKYWMPNNYREISKGKKNGADNVNPEYSCVTCDTELIKLGSAEGKNNKFLWGEYCQDFKHHMDPDVMATSASGSPENIIYNNCQDFYVCNKSSSPNNFMDSMEAIDSFAEGAMGISPPILSNAADAVFDYVDPNNQISTTELVSTLGNDAINILEKVYSPESLASIKSIFTNTMSVAQCSEGQNAEGKPFTARERMECAKNNASNVVPGFTNIFSTGTVDLTNPLSASNVGIIKANGLNLSQVCKEKPSMLLKMIVVDMKIIETNTGFSSNEEYEIYHAGLNTDQLEAISRKIENCQTTGTMGNLFGDLKFRSNAMTDKITSAELNPKLSFLKTLTNCSYTLIKTIEDCNSMNASNVCKENFTKNMSLDKTNHTCMGMVHIDNNDYNGTPCAYPSGHILIDTKSDGCTDKSQCTFKTLPCAHIKETNGSFTSDSYKPYRYQSTPTLQTEDITLDDGSIIPKDIVPPSCRNKDITPEHIGSLLHTDIKIKKEDPKCNIDNTPQYSGTQSCLLNSSNVGDEIVYLDNESNVAQCVAVKELGNPGYKTIYLKTSDGSNKRFGVNGYYHTYNNNKYQMQPLTTDDYNASNNTHLNLCNASSGGKPINLTNKLFDQLGKSGDTIEQIYKESNLSNKKSDISFNIDCALGENEYKLDNGVINDTGKRWDGKEYSSNFGDLCSAWYNEDEDATNCGIYTTKENNAIYHNNPKHECCTADLIPYFDNNILCSSDKLKCDPKYKNKKINASSINCNKIIYTDSNTKITNTAIYDLSKKLYIINETDASRTIANNDLSVKNLANWECHDDSKDTCCDPYGDSTCGKQFFDNPTLCEDKKEQSPDNQGSSIKECCKSDLATYFDNVQCSKYTCNGPYIETSDAEDNKSYCTNISDGFNDKLTYDPNTFKYIDASNNPVDDLDGYACENDLNNDKCCDSQRVKCDTDLCTGYNGTLNEPGDISCNQIKKGDDIAVYDNESNIYMKGMKGNHLKTIPVNNLSGWICDDSDTCCNSYDDTMCGKQFSKTPTLCGDKEQKLGTNYMNADHTPRKNCCEDTTLKKYFNSVKCSRYSCGDTKLNLNKNKNNLYCDQIIDAHGREYTYNSEKYMYTNSDDESATDISDYKCSPENDDTCCETKG